MYSQSYRRAIQIDECLGRPHLNLAVIYHLKEQYTEAMLHYTYASQLDASGTHAKLINENMRKLRRQRQNSSYQQQQSAFFTQKTCQSRTKTLGAQASPTNTQSPNTTFDYEKRSSFISNSGTEGTIGSTSSFFSLHTASIF